MISRCTKDALRAAKARGVILGNAKQTEANRNGADARNSVMAQMEKAATASPISVMNSRCRI
jgi:hypothetical protein